MKAVVFLRKSGRPDSRILEHDGDFDDVARRIAIENEGVDIIGIMDYEEATRWVLERL